MPRKLLEHLGLAGLALILAFLVWIGATFEENPPDTIDFPDPIAVELINRAPGLMIRNQSADRVTIRVRGHLDSLQRLTKSSFRATADLGGLGVGIHTLPVEIEVGDRAVTLVSQEPPSISFALDRLEEKLLPVQVSIMDPSSVPLGYSSRPATADPPELRVSGPKSLVDRVSEARVSVFLQGAKTTVEKRIAARLLDASGDVISELDPDPLLVTVTVPIEQDVGFRDVTARAVITGTPASGYWVSNILVQPPTITVFGLPATLEKTGGFLPTAPIDISGAKADLVKRVPLELPSGISILSEDGQKGIQVTIGIAAIVGGQTIRKPVSVQGLSLGLKASVSPDMVDIILSGPLPILQEMPPEDTEVVVDLFGLSVGTHRVAPRAVVPEGLEVVSIVPDTVEINIELGP